MAAAAQEQKRPCRWDEQYSGTSSCARSVPGFVSECIGLCYSAVTLLALCSAAAMLYDRSLEEVQPSLPCLLVASDGEATSWAREEVWKDRRLSWLHRESGSGISGKRNNSHNELEEAGERWRTLEVSSGSSLPRPQPTAAGE